MVKVQALDPKSGTATTAEAALQLPHLLFSDLAREYEEQFHSLFATDGLGSEVEKTPDDRFDEHPIAPDKRVQQKDRTIPLFLHGDGVEFQTRDSLMCWSFGGFLNKKASLDCHLHISCWPKSCTHKTTWDPLYKWIKWRFEALLKGKHPERGPDDEALPKGFEMEVLQGQPLAPGSYRAVLWSIQGDADFYSNVLDLPDWSTRFPCWECDCQIPVYKKRRCPAGKSVKILTEGNQRSSYVNSAEALAWRVSMVFSATAATAYCLQWLTCTPTSARTYWTCCPIQRPTSRQKSTATVPTAQCFRPCSFMLCHAWVSALVQ